VTFLSALRKIFRHYPQVPDFLWNIARGSSIATSNDMEPVMPGPEYYRRQADICLGLSLLGEDPFIAEALIAKATELLERAKEAERGTEIPVPPSQLTRRDEFDGVDAGCQ
jgi:hypothetical protein